MVTAQPPLFQILICLMWMNLIMSAATVVAQARGGLQCPPIIGDTRTNIFSRSVLRRNRYECFRTEDDARRKGFVSSRQLETQSATGWWRVAVTKKRTTCPGDGGKDLTVNFFLQAREETRGRVLFGEFCPSTGRFVGSRRDGVVSASSSRVVDGETLCSGATAEVTYLLTLSDLTPSKANRATVSRITRCLSGPPSASSPSDPSLSLQTCVAEWEGIAFRETLHKFFPPVPEDLNTFETTCAFAQTKCLDCHS
jgi:hypothetical protein